jgi:hypothetical protein
MTTSKDERDRMAGVLREQGRAVAASAKGTGAALAVIGVATFTAARSVGTAFAGTVRDAARTVTREAEAIVAERRAAEETVSAPDAATAT